MNRDSRDLTSLSAVAPAKRACVPSVSLPPLDLLFKHQELSGGIGFVKGVGELAMLQTYFSLGMMVGLTLAVVTILFVVRAP
jgi:hypothetical protein